jgi:hypothetical protein
LVFSISADLPKLSQPFWRMTAIIKNAGAKDRTGFFG